MDQKYDNPMRRQLYSIETLITSIYPDTEKKTRTILSTPEIYSLKQVVITGCGDSYCAAMAAKQAFRKLTGLSVAVLPAIEASRMELEEAIGQIPNNPLMIGISNSGRVTRVMEGLMRFRQAGALTLAITSNQDSPLAKEAERNVVLSIPEFEKAPGIRNYVCSMLALFLLAIRIGEVLGRYTMDLAFQYRKELVDSVKYFSQSLKDQEEKIFKMAQEFSDVTSGELIAQGNDVSAAVFIQQKMYEAIGLPCVWGDSESWFHTNKFLRDFEHTLTFVYLSKGDKGKERVLEALKRMDYMKRSYIVVTDDEIESKYVLDTPLLEHDIFSPIAEFGPPCLLLSYLTEIKQEIYSRGFKYPYCDAPGIPGTVESQLNIVSL